MTMYVYGLGHLGYVTVAGLSRWGHHVIGIHPEHTQVPEEPGLQEALADGEHAGRLQFAFGGDFTLKATDVLWITFDTPISSSGQPDVGILLEHIRHAFANVPPKTLGIISSQVPVGFCRALQMEFPQLTLVSNPENLRHGTAFKNFVDPERIVLGVSANVDRKTLREIFPEDLWSKILWMSTESAEMSKHATNAFLGTSIVFANEISRVCQAVGASYADVEQVLRADPRIGTKAYIRDGKADTRHFLRDIRYLTDTASDQEIILELVSHLRDGLMF